MFGDSICKTRKSIRKLSCTKRSKRNEGQVVTNPAAPEGSVSSQILERLYYDESDEYSPEMGSSSNTTYMVDSVVTAFKPFRAEKHLCFADRSSSYKPANSKNIPISETPGFLSCLATLQSESNVVENCNLVITDSELLNCCHQVEAMLETTPHKRLRLVNSILDDFALSPYKPQENPKFWAYSPEFVLKSKPRITYSSRRRKTRQNVDCNKRLDFSSNEECLSDSSSISIQENYSQFGEISTTVVPDTTTERLCENLLNLSAYYTQKSPGLDVHNPDVLSSKDINDDNTKMDSWRTFSNVVCLVQEITSLRKNIPYSQQNDSLYNSTEDFFGFPEESIDHDVENEATFLDNQCNRSDVILLSPSRSQITDGCRKMFMDIKADAHDDNSAGQRSKNGDQFDEWNDDYMDIFALIKTPPRGYSQERRKCPDVIEQSRDNVCLGFKTASSKHIHISKEAKSKALQLLMHLPEITPKEAVKCDNLNATSMQVRDDIMGSNDLEIMNLTFKCSGINNMYDQPSTSKAALRANKEFERIRNVDCNSTDKQPNNTTSKQIKYTSKCKDSEDVIINKKLQSSKKAHESVEKICKDFYAFRQDNIDFYPSEVKNENNQKMFINSTSNSKAVGHNPNEPTILRQLDTSDYNVGFQTANGKNIKPTSKALKSVAKLLKEFECDLEQFDANGLELMKNDINRKQSHQLGSDTKAIMVQENNSFCAEEADLSNVIFSEWPLEKELIIQSSQTNSPAGNGKKPIEVDFTTPAKISTLNTEFEGFTTAGGKKVSTSEKSKKLVENLLDQVKNSCGANDILKIKNSILTKNNKNVLTHKRLIVQNDEASGSASEEALGGCNKAQYSPLHASKSPLSASVTNSIISRKNNLSLSRRRRGSGLVSPARETNINALAETIKELPSEHSVTPNKTQSCINNTTLVVHTPSTPNANDLPFTALKCSTPRVIRPQNMDDDFKPISCNKSISDTCSNVTFSSPNPSVHERIGRLRMYGEPPPISPILTNFHSNWRSSGLKRTRSMLKKADNK